MPTILFIYGWKLYFYSNESHEPIHIHVQKGDAQAKFWIIVDEIEITEAFSYNFTSANKRQVKKIVYQNFDIIVDAWFNHFVKIKDE